MSDRHHREGKLDLVQIRAAAEAGEASRRFWRSLDELAETPEVASALHHEFPRGLPRAALTRRDLLKSMGASAALAGLTACTKLPIEKIVPYVRQPEEFTPGVPLYYATAMPQSGVGIGLLVESHLGRPTKVEGNPGHPGSLGAADIFAQASVLQMYDPDRSQVVKHVGRLGTWEELAADIGNNLDNQRPLQGAGIRLLTGTVTSPTLADQIQAFLAQFPSARWHQYEPVGRDNARAGAKLAFGEYVNTVYRLDRAEVVLSLEADFLGCGPGTVRYARDFTDRRRVVDTRSTMNRLYVVESTPSNTGAMADHRWPMRASEVEGFARAVAAALGVKAGGGAVPPSVPAGAVAALARDLQAHRGASAVMAGDAQPPIVHALAHAMNEALGNAGQTVIHTAPIEANPVDELQSLRELVAAIQAGQVDTLIIIGGNPVYNAPADLSFADELLKVRYRVHLGLYEDETAVLCHWHLPQAHYLEAWGDVRAYDGTVSIIQPLIAPLYNGRSEYEFLALLNGQAGRSGHDLVRDYWRRQLGSGTVGGADFETQWETWLNNGVVDGTALPPKVVSLRASFEPAPAAPDAGGLELIFRPDPTVGDGSYANLGWLQELPKPFTSLTWDNAAYVSVATAERFHLERADFVRLRFQGRELEAPVFIVPGQANDCVTVFLGYGRQRAGRMGTGVGFNAYALRTSANPWFGPGLDLRKTGQKYHLVTLQNDHLINDREGRKVFSEESEAAFARGLVRVATLEQFRSHPDFAADPPEETTDAQSLYPPYDYQHGYQWGMSIDLNACTGCNACVVACYAENNNAVVGKEQVDDGRDMAWIRVDKYFRGGLDNPEMYNQVVLCMMCENAPCEYVCPVGATLHSPEGLNLMVYNRCVGTRYCSNNCPYKVRRFNFYLFSDWDTPSLYPLRNPDVTVRSRGVMEKCTYCVQRIQEAKIRAEVEDRVVKDGEIQTACQQTCPTQAIVFGNINDPNSRVSRLKAQSRQYGLLRDLNTRPRTTYLAKLRNPNPEIQA